MCAALAIAGCSLPEVADDEPLEPIHGTIDPAVLTPRAAAVAAEVPPAPADGRQWRIASAIDGRTLELHQGLERATATLAGIDVPVGDACLAQHATDSLAFITGGGRTVTVTPPEARNGRIDDATVVGDTGDDLALVMLSLGLARATGEGPDPATYRSTEQDARDQELGIWSPDCDG